jgi:hypothetical protein
MVTAWHIVGWTIPASQAWLQEIALLEATQSGRSEIGFDLDPADNKYLRKHQTFVDYGPNEEKKWKDSETGDTTL